MSCQETSVVKGVVQCGQGGFFRCDVALFGAKHIKFFEIYGVSARTRG